MSDEADQADIRIEREREIAIAAVRNVKEPVPTGACFYCDEPVGEGLRYCNKDCLTDHEEERRLRARQGQR